MRFLFISLTAIALLIGTACSRSAARADDDLVSALISALNSKDKAKVEAFVAKFSDPDVPAAMRVTRLLALAGQAAPITLVKKLPDRTGDRRALIKDKNGEELGFVVEINEAGKMKRLMVGPPDSLNAAPPKDYTGWQNLQTLTETLRADTDNPAMTICLMRDGKLEQAVAGMREQDGKDPVRSDEVWSIGSIGKPICATIVARLIEAGKLKWDTTLGEALPDISMKEGYKSATLEQIMHHRGGIPPVPGLRRPEVQRIVADATEPAKIRENFARDILQKDMIGAPGAQFEYSNAGYALLGVIAERATGKPYEKLVHELIFEPLGLTHSYTAGDKLPDGRPSGHVNGPTGWEKLNMSGPIETIFAPAGGGLFMSAADLCRFGQLHLDGLRGKDGLLKASTIARLHKGAPEQGPGGREYACGWGIEQYPGFEQMHTHNGSNGTMRAQLAIFPKAGLVVASFTNAGGESEPSPPLQAVLAIAGRYAKQ